MHQKPSPYDPRVSRFYCRQGCVNDSGNEKYFLKVHTYQKHNQEKHPALDRLLSQDQSWMTEASVKIEKEQTVSSLKTLKEEKENAIAEVARLRREQTEQVKSAEQKFSELCLELQNLKESTAEELRRSALEKQALEAEVADLKVVVMEELKSTRKANAEVNELKLELQRIYSEMGIDSLSAINTETDALTSRGCNTQKVPPLDEADAVATLLQQSIAKGATAIDRKNAERIIVSIEEMKVAYMEVAMRLKTLALDGDALLTEMNLFTRHRLSPLKTDYPYQSMVDELTHPEISHLKTEFHS